MDKIAIISDIHGNLEALKAVLKDIKRNKIKRIYCLGDIISKGINSSACLDLIKENCEVIIKGNCDSYYSSSFSFDKICNRQKERIIWNKSLLTNDQQEYLINLPFCYEFYMSGSLIRLFHASPDKIDELITNLDSFERKKSMFLPSSNTISQNIADVVIYGHIHIQHLERLYNRTIVNAGSVGNPLDIVRNDNFDADVMETTRANYLIVEGIYGSKTYDNNLSFIFKKVPYNIDKELKYNKTNPEKELYKKELKEGKYRDIERIKKQFLERNINIDKI